MRLLESSLPRNFCSTVFALLMALLMAPVAHAQTKTKVDAVPQSPPKGQMVFFLKVQLTEGFEKSRVPMLGFRVQVDGIGKNKAFIVNGIERIPVDTEWDASTNEFAIDMPHYASRIELQRAKDLLEGKDAWSGVWSKRRGEGNVAQTACNAVVFEWQSLFDDPKPVLGRWEVKFEGDDDAAVGVFQKAEDSNEVYGTFLTTTGDYRYLSGGLVGDELTLSCFDGGHAFLFKAKVHEDGSLDGMFSSGSWYVTSWTAKRNADITLPDAFKQTTWTGKVALSELKFPGLDGVEVALDDERFAGKCRIIEVFGSWCPNCHDAGVYLSELQNKYKDRGLSITGLAFELTGDLQEDTAQVKTFIERNKTEYPILVAGTSDKSQATEQLKLLDRVRSYPTMIFLDQGGNVRAIYTGFSGPATGEAHVKLRSQFEKLIEGILDE